MARKATLTDVAREAGVSIATVDRVINSRGGVERSKEEKVMRAARLLELDRRLDFASSQIRRVAVMVQPPTNPFHAELQAGIETARKMLAPLSVQMQVVHIPLGGHADIAKRIRGLRSWADGLIISTSDVPEIAEAIRSISDAIPVITLATDIADCGRVAYVGPNDERSGRIAGDLLGMFMGESGGHVMMLVGRLDMAGHRARAKGFSEILQRRHPQCVLSRMIETGEQRDLAHQLVHRSLKADPFIRGIYLLSVGATEVVEAVEGLGRQGTVHIVSHELTSNRRELLRQRRIHAVLDQNPRRETRLAAEAIACQLGRLAKVEEPLETNAQIFMAENV
ncbi:LacI family DNA-binding transcriptional regulator [Aliiruegeria lutimaris]|uniref:Transcriptional regulator, LacI family n=1 Tax=Aliiruegeria lutimaris TaxID=571298 RepID=A0A1G8QB51_9RHOB|nr:LacI family DNA-binding transcriptional regulator [Aliiruegeria lutimaris]SDJ01992.1 transcriptional regulator, LacI family [Aliiruegeria lutimaris]